MNKEIKQGLVFGLNIGELLGTYDQSSQSWKTSQLYLFEDLMSSWDRLPKSGIMLNGRIYGQVTWARRINGNESGLLPTPRAQELGRTSEGYGTCLTDIVKGYKKTMWPTPDCSDRRSMKSKQQGLSNAVKKWPTPMVMDAYTDKMKSSQQTEGSLHSVTLAQKVKWPTPKKQNANGTGIHGQGGMDLQTAVQKFPTPSATDYKGSVKGETLQKRMNYSRGVRLPEQIMREQFPTPTTTRPHDNENTAGKYFPSQKQKDLTYAIAQNGGNLNPQWVCWLMGYPLAWTDLRADLQLSLIKE